MIENQVLNLTQHKATPEQVSAGVVDLNSEDRLNLSTLLTFNSVPKKEHITEKAAIIADMAVKAGSFKRAMIGGAPYLMAPLTEALKEVGIQPLFAFSKRESVEKTNEDGTVTKTAVFKHVGWVEA